MVCYDVMDSLYFGTSSFLQQKCDGDQDEMLNNTKKDNGLPLCESEETSLDSKSEKSVSIVTDGFVPNIVFNRILLYLLDMCVMFFLLLQLFMRSFFY